jgi:hypothetical protein
MGPTEHMGEQHVACGLGTPDLDFHQQSLACWNFMTDKSLNLMQPNFPAQKLFMKIKLSISQGEDIYLWDYLKQVT